MQEEAVRRVREMQRRSKSYSEPAPQSPAIPAVGAAEPESGKKSGGSAEKAKPLFNIAGIAVDEEKAMIALLIYILYKNKADMKLILALGYLLI